MLFALFSLSVSVTFMVLIARVTQKAEDVLKGKKQFYSVLMLVLN